MFLFLFFFRDPKLLATLKKKKECEKKAYSIVEKLIDGLLEEDELLNEVKFLNYKLLKFIFLNFIDN